MSLYAQLATISLPNVRLDRHNLFTLWSQAVDGAIGALIALFLFVCLTYLIHLLVTPIRQRNEARKLLDESRTIKKIPLRNRNELIRIIGIVKQRVIDLKMKQDNLDFKEKKRENPQEELTERDNAWFAYLDAKKDLETERLVAGDNFRAIIDNLMMFVDYHVYDCMKMISAKNKPETLKTIPFMTQLDNNIEQAIRDLDVLSLKEPDKEGSQTE